MPQESTFRLDIGPEKYWKGGVYVVEGADPVITGADVYFSSPNMGVHIGIDVKGGDEIEALNSLYRLLVLYGIWEVAKVVNEEIEKREELESRKHKED